MSRVQPSYTYDAKIISTYDGDTMTILTDMGARIHTEMEVRLYGIDTPENNTAEGKRVTSYVQTLLPPGTAIVVETIKDRHGRWRKEKYGRFLARIWFDGPAGQECLNAHLLNGGMARVAPWK